MKALTLLSAFIALTLVMSCLKTVNDDNLGLNNIIKTKKTDFTQFGDTLAETFVVNLNQKTPSVKTTKNTQIIIPNGAFENKKGETVMGNITLVIRELRRPSEMLFADKPAMTKEGGILESYGEFHIAAFQNGEPLQLRNNMVLSVTTPLYNKDNPTNMPLWEADTSIKKVYTGLNQNADRVNTLQSITKMSGSIWQTNGQKVLINNEKMMQFDIPKLNMWFNCDVLKPLQTDNLTTVLVHFSQNYTPSVSNDYFEQQPSVVFFKPNGFNGLIKFYNPIITNELDKQGFHSYENSIPIGTKGKLLAFTVHEGHYFVDLKNIIITQPEAGKKFISFRMQPIEVTKASFLEAVKSLD